MNGSRVTPLAGVLSQFTLPSRSGLLRLARQARAGARRPRSLLAVLPASLGALRERLRRWSLMAAQRRQLARLDDRMLKDIGLSRGDAHQEARKWFWQV